MGGLASLGINLPTLLAQIINFAILFGLLYLVAYKPIMRMLDERSRKIRESMEQTEFIKEQAVHAEEEVKKQLEAAGREGQEVIGRAVRTGEEIKREAQQEAKQEAEALAQIADLVEYRAALPRYYTGQILEEQMGMAAETVVYQVWTKGMRRTYEAKDFSPDGLECTVGMRQAGGTMYARNRQSGETQQWSAESLTILRMRYDLADERWKMAKVLEIIPVAQ